MSVSAESVRHAAAGHGLAARVQEMITWNSMLCQDCFSLLVKCPDPAPAPPVVFLNDSFWDDISTLRKALLPYHAARLGKIGRGG